MRKITLAFALVFLTAFAAKAQTLTRTMFPSIGDTIVYWSDTNTVIQGPGAAGQGQNWIFNLDNTELITSIYKAPAGTQFASSFPGSNLAMEAAGFTFYFNKTIDTLFVQGAGGTIGSITTALKNNPQVIDHVHNSSFGTTYSRVSFYSVTVHSSVINAALAGFPFNIDSLRLKRVTNRVVLFDGTGSLQINGFSYPSTLREKVTEYYIDSVFSRKNGVWQQGVALAPLAPNIPPRTLDTAFIYRWYEDGTTSYLMSLTVDAEDSVATLLHRYQDPCATPYATGAISGPTSAQQGSTQNYSVSGSPGSTYNWVVTGGTISSGQNSSSITVVWGTGSTGSISVEETNTFGCTGTPATANVSLTASNPCSGVTVSTGPITGPNNVLQGSQQIYNVTGTSGSSFAWTATGGTIASGNGTSQVTVDWGTGASGSLSVVETTTAGCSGAAVTYAVTLTSPSSISDDLATSTVVFPNPVYNADLNISSQITEAGQINIRILDLSGRAVFSQVYSATPGAFHATLPTATLPSGLYFVELRSSNGAAVTTKIVIGQ